MSAEVQPASDTSSPNIFSKQTRLLVRRQVEFYLSDANLSRDALFGREIQKRKDGGIPIALLLNCNRLKEFDVTERLLVKAIEKSSLIKLSVDGSAVLRTTPFVPLTDREKRTVLVVGIPRSLDASTVSMNEPPTDPPAVVNLGIHSDHFKITEWLREVFTQFGTVLCVNLPRYHSSGMFRGFAFVEFSTPKEARTAIKAMSPDPSKEVWHVAPITTDEQSEDNNMCPEAAWKPRLAAKCALHVDHALARRYIWRCCSRKNKQIQRAFQQLRSSGYRARNPCDREYELITLGSCSPEVREQYWKQLCKEADHRDLYVFRYAVWGFWRSKFYDWLNAWVMRMRWKTGELSINEVHMQQESSNPEIYFDEECEKMDTQPSTSDDHRNVDIPNINDLRLPQNFVKNSVLQIRWPIQLVDTDNIPSAVSENQVINDEVPRVPKVSLARRIRISLERYLLHPCNLLQEVAHFDSIPHQLILNHVSLAQLSSNEVDTNRSFVDSYTVFVRMKSATAACLCNEYIASLHSDVSIGDEDLRKQIQCDILQARSELAYCTAIAESLVGAHERRRRIQARRRQRPKLIPSTSPPVTVVKQLENGSCKMLLNRPEHTRFDDV